MNNPPRTPADTGGEHLRSSFIRAFEMLVREVFRMNGQLLATGDHLSKDTDVSTARWQVMATLYRDAATVGQISSRLGLRRQSVQESVNRLQGQNLIRLDANPRHARASLVSLTPRGREVIEVLRRRQLNALELLMREFDLPVEEINALTRQLRKAREATESIVAHDFLGGESPEK